MGDVRSLRFRIFVLLLAALPSARAVERDIERKFAVRPGCSLKIDTYRGSIAVEETDAAEVTVAVHLEINADSDAEADRIGSALQLDFTAGDNTVAVRARNPRETGLRFDWRDKDQIGLTYAITVPRECSVDLVTVKGNITVGSLAGHQSARAESGAVFFRRIEGSVDARVETGDIIVSRCSGPVTLRVMHGTIRTGTVGGRADLRNDSGDIDVLSARSGIVADCSAGDITVGFPKGHSGETTINTSGGGIYAKIAPEADCLIDASSIWGHVESQLPLQIESGGLGKSKLTALLNAGGPRVTLHANGGHVKITAFDAELD